MPFPERHPSQITGTDGGAPSRAEWEWIVALAVLRLGLVTRTELRRETKLAFPRSYLMRSCPKCGAPVYSVCLACRYHGGSVERVRHPDVVEHCANRGRLRVWDDYFAALGRWDLVGRGD